MARYAAPTTWSWGSARLDGKLLKNLALQQHDFTTYTHAAEDAPSITHGAQSCCRQKLQVSFYDIKLPAERIMELPNDPMVGTSPS